MGGGSQRGYVRSLVQYLIDHGYEVAVCHVIGTGETPYTSAHFADFSSNTELKKCVDFVAKSGAEIVGVGLSLGANQMMKLSAEDGSCPLKAMVSVNNPFDITTNNNVMRGTFYEKYLVKATVKNVVVPDFRSTKEQERAVFVEMQSKFGLDFEKLKRISTWRELDELFTRKVNPQYKSVVSYYNAASCLHNI
jgi:predicted alpha/beta-fold hydrolase